MNQKTAKALRRLQPDWREATYRPRQRRGGLRACWLPIRLDHNCGRAQYKALKAAQS